MASDKLDRTHASCRSVFAAERISGLQRYVLCCNSAWRNYGCCAVILEQNVAFQAQCQQ